VVVVDSLDVLAQHQLQHGGLEALRTISHLCGDKTDYVTGGAANVVGCCGSLHADLFTSNLAAHAQIAGWCTMSRAAEHELDPSTYS
jgi:hypothetical protein